MSPKANWTQCILTCSIPDRGTLLLRPDEDDQRWSTPREDTNWRPKQTNLLMRFAFLPCRDPSNNVLSQDRIPEPGQAKALALEAAKRSYQDRTHTVPPSTFSRSDRTVRNVLHDKNYLGEGHPLMASASIHHTKAHRVAEQKISRNMLAAAFALYQAYEHLPNSMLGSLDTTIINHPGTWSTRRGVVSWKKRTLYRSLNRNFVSVNTAHPDAVVHTNPFQEQAVPRYARFWSVSTVPPLPRGSWHGAQ